MIKENNCPKCGIRMNYINGSKMDTGMKTYICLKCFRVYSYTESWDYDLMNPEKSTETQMEEAIKIVGPVAAMCGIDSKDTELILSCVDEMSQKGISGAQAGHALRVILKNKLNQEQK